MLGHKEGDLIDLAVPDSQGANAESVEAAPAGQSIRFPYAPSILLAAPRTIFTGSLGFEDRLEIDFFKKNIFMCLFNKIIF